MHISSGYYSFKFERDAHLGMIAPIWEKFPEAKRPGCTSILLKLAPDCDQNAIDKELCGYDSRILIFLRRLRRLEITSRSTKTVLTRQDRPSSNPSMMILKNGRKSVSYLVWRHTARDLPQDERRPGIKSSEVVLAFPLNRDEDQPLLERQSVYAFLPIRDYGFSVSSHPLGNGLGIAR